jgi:hypothetical protein
VLETKNENANKIKITTMTIAAMVVLIALNIIPAAFASESTASRFNQGFDDGCNT